MAFNSSKKLGDNMSAISIREKEEQNNDNVIGLYPDKNEEDDEEQDLNYGGLKR